MKPGSPLSVLCEHYHPIHTKAGFQTHMFDIHIPEIDDSKYFRMVLLLLTSHSNIQMETLSFEL